MKSTKFTTMALIAMIALSLNTLTSCKKNPTTSLSSADSTQTQTDDEVMVSNETDNASNDGTSVLESRGGSFAARPEVGPINDTIPLPCDGGNITADTTSGGQDSIFVTYSGSNCSGTRSRTGKIIVSFAHGLHWQTPNAAITVTYQNFTVVRTSDHKTLTINGSETITNVSGYDLRNLTSAPGDSIVHNIAGTLHLTFNNGSTATWNITKHRVFTYNSGLIITTTGSITGTNRFGNQFSTVITNPITIANCGYGFRVTTGTVIYTAPIGTVTLTFGLDAAGQVAGACPLIYYYEIQYVHNSVTYTYNAPYF